MWQRQSSLFPLSGVIIVLLSISWADGALNVDDNDGKYSEKEHR